MNPKAPPLLSGWSRSNPHAADLLRRLAYSCIASKLHTARQVGGRPGSRFGRPIRVAPSNTGSDGCLSLAKLTPAAGLIEVTLLAGSRDDAVDVTVALLARRIGFVAARAYGIVAAVFTHAPFASTDDAVERLFGAH